MTTVLTYGTFDLLHFGHIRLLKRLRSMGDRLIVGLSTDEFNENKGKRSVVSYEHRKELLDSVRYVDLVFPEVSWQQKRQDIEKYDVDIFAMGDDWVGKFDELQDIVNVLYVPRTNGISTTSMKTVLCRYNADMAVSLHNALEHAMSLSKMIISTNGFDEKKNPK